MIYCDNAATSFPKPPQVAEAMVDFITNCGGSPGRSGHSLSTEAGRRVFEVRELLADFFEVSDSSRIVFTGNATHSLNLALFGLLKPKDRAVTSSMEHNSVMRPLNYLSRAREVRIDRLNTDRRGWIDPDDVKTALKKKPARLVVLTGASNVTGTIQDLTAVSEICHRHGAILLVDAAQLAGSIPLDCSRQGIDLLAFTGHKALYGPTGIGGLVIGDGIDIEPLMRGGTGSRSEEEEHPDFLPDRLEAGTHNTVGIVGLGAGLTFLREKGVEAVRRHEIALVERFLDGLSSLSEVTIHGPAKAEDRTPVVSISVKDLLPSEVGFLLDTGFDIKVRVGLHCAPSAHRTIGTFPEGTVRFSFGCFNTLAEVDEVISAVARLVSQVRS